MTVARRAAAHPVATAAILTSIIVTAVLAVYALTPRDFLTGANGVRPLSLIATVPEGERLCARGVDIPAESAGIAFAAGREDSAAKAHVTVSGDSVRRRATVDIPRFGDITARFPEVASDTTATVCVRAVEGAVVLAGAAGTQSNDRKLQLNGEDLDARLSMRFVPVEGAQRSLVGQWATVMDRAALFRPSFVTPAVLWILLLIVLPVTLVAAVVGVATGVEAPRALVLLGVVTFVSAGSWALITLPFDSPDESEHFAYLQSVAERGTRPDSEPTARGVYATGQTLALEAVRHPTRIGGKETRPPWSEAARDRYQQRVKENLPLDDGGGFADATRLHLPAYYSLLVPAYELGGDDIFAQLTLARLLSALLGVVVAFCAFGIVRELVPRRPELPLLAGLLVALQPMFSFIAGAVNNDMGVNAAAGLVAYLGVRLVRRQEAWVGIAFGAALAVAPVMKGTGLAMIPPALLVVAGYVLRQPARRASAATVAGLGAAFLLVAIAVRSLLSAAVDNGALGSVSGEGAVGPGILGSLGPKLAYTWQLVLPRLPFMQDYFLMTWPFYDIYIVRGWGAFGWYSFSFSRATFIAVILVGVLLMGLGARAIWRARARFREWGWEVAFLLAIPITVIVAISFAYYTTEARVIPGEQGRYLFTAAAPLAALATMSLLGLPSRWQRPAAAALVVALAGLAYGGRLTYLSGVFT